jgi:hypothetical protein
MKCLLFAAILLSGFGARAQTAKAPNEKPQTAAPKPIHLLIEGSNCSYLNTDFDTGLPLSGASVCMAQAHHKLKDGSSVIVILSCNGQFATCARLGFNQTYELESISAPEYPECGKPKKVPNCWKVHARPYDLVYLSTLEADCTADQPPGTAAYDACKAQAATNSGKNK